MQSTTENGLPPRLTSTKHWKIRYLSLLLGHALLFVTSTTATADSGTPRYVAIEGANSTQGQANDCTNPFRPCGSIIYAINQSTKSDQVYVAKGEYILGNSLELVTLLSNSYRVHGGYSKVNHFNASSPTEHPTTLTGVPAAHRQSFAEQGFRIISDLKHMSRSQEQEANKLSKLMVNSQQSHSATDCVDNRAETFDCGGINLLSHIGIDDLPLGANRSSDVWGFVDLNTLREYAFIGLNTGVAIVDVTDGEAPYIVDSHRGVSNDWRDIKVYQYYDQASDRWKAYAYVTSEAVEGLMIIDLSGLPNSTTSRIDNSDVVSAHNAYVAGVDHTFGAPVSSTQPVLTIAGRVFAGEDRVFSLTDPGAPTYQNSAGNEYMHDGSSAIISDDRKNSQCINATQTDYCMVYADFNEDAFVIVDLTDPSDPRTLSTTSYTHAEYVHSGWWSEDGNTLFVHDELDEFFQGLVTSVRVFDVSDLTNPQLIDTWTSNNRSIDHNGFVRGNRYYMSNYTAGLTVLDITNPSSITRVGHFDTFPASNLTQFSGAWGAYPFFPSNKIAISDINSGLYILEDNTLNASAGSLEFSRQHYSGAEGQTMAISVERLNGSSGEVRASVRIQYLTAQNEDIEAASVNTLVWADGDTSPKTISLTLAEDGINEPMEQVALWLHSPTGGATLTNGGLAHLAVYDSAKPSSISPLSGQSVSDRHQTQPVQLVVQRKSSASGAVSAEYSIHLTAGSTDTTIATGTLSWDDGDATNKIITVPAEVYSSVSHPDALSIFLSNPQGADIEAGNDTIEINPTTAPTPTTPTTPTEPTDNPSPTSSSSGGGNVHWILLVCLGALLLSQFPLARTLARQK